MKKKRGKKVGRLEGEVGGRRAGKKSEMYEAEVSG